MAKTVEEKAVASMLAAMSDKSFREHEFSRIMVEALYNNRIPAHQDFMQVVYSFIVYLSTFDAYEYYPNGSKEMAQIAAYVRPYFDSALGVDLTEELT